MIPERRQRFNSQFTEAKYQQFRQSLDAAVGTKIGVRLCETPVFLPEGLLAEMQEAGAELIAQMRTTEYLAASSQAVPAEYCAPNEGTHPHFILIDFAVIRDVDGCLAPKLIELQAIPSLYALQLMMAHEYQRVFGLNDLEYLLNGLTDVGYLDLLGRTLLNGHAPEHVVLMDVDPPHQATLADFKATEQLFGIVAVDISEIVKRGNRLFYQRDGRKIEIRRLYNRVMIDELICKGVHANFDYRDELDVEWAGHPNWGFRISKFALPFLNHSTVPRAWFGDHLEECPSGLDHVVLKPLFSFGGNGVKIGITREDIKNIPVADRGSYVLQEEVRYAPVVETPDDPSKVEVRLMYVWPDGDEEPTAATTLPRLSKGAMMGVRFNTNKTWVGSSCSFLAP